MMYMRVTCIDVCWYVCMSVCLLVRMYECICILRQLQINVYCAADQRVLRRQVQMHMCVSFLCIYLYVRECMYFLRQLQINVYCDDWYRCTRVDMCGVSTCVRTCVCMYVCT